MLLDSFDQNRPLTANDLQMISAVGRPMDSFEQRQLSAGIPFSDILRSANAQLATLQRAVGRSGNNAPSQDDRDRLADIEKYRRTEAAVGQTFAQALENSKNREVKMAASTKKPEVKSKTVSIAPKTPTKASSSVQDALLARTLQPVPETISRAISGERTLPAQTPAPSRFAASSPTTVDLISPTALAQFVMKNGITNLQNYSWWSSSPYKQEAWRIISGQQSPQSPVSQLQPAGSTQLALVSTGNPQVDEIANAYLEALWAQYQQYQGGLPSQIDDATLKALEGEVERVYGPSIAKYKDLAEQEFQTYQRIGREQTGIGREGLALDTARAGEDVRRLGGEIEEDKLRYLADNARNYDEAKLQVQEQFRQRGLTFSGERERKERLLEDERTRNEEEIEKTAKRQSEELGRSQKRLGEDVALQGRGLDLSQEQSEFGLKRGLEETMQNLTDFRARQLAESQAYNENLPFQIGPYLLNQPFFANQQGITPPSYASAPQSTPAYAGASTPPAASKSALPVPPVRVLPISNLPAIAQYIQSYTPMGIKSVAESINQRKLPVKGF